MATRQEIANNIKGLRCKKGYKQEDMAQILGISRQSYSAREKAQIPWGIEEIPILAKLFKTTEQSLLDAKYE